MEEEECDCGRQHDDRYGARDSAETAAELAALMTSGTHYLIPGCGMVVMSMWRFMATVADAMYIDVGPGIWKDGPVNFGYFFGALAMADADEENFSAVFTVPKDTPVDRMQAAFPGCFEDGVLPTQTVVAVGDASAVALPSMLIDAVMLWDPQQGMALVGRMRDSD